jgi:tRNA modification GTPase
VRRALSGANSAREHLGIAPELSGEDIRSALRALDELAGRSDIEEVFDRIFSQFCVGK